MLSFNPSAIPSGDVDRESSFRQNESLDTESIMEFFVGLQGFVCIGKNKMSNV